MNEDMDKHIEDVTLPELSDARIDEIEDALFTAIARDRVVGGEQTARARRARRGRIWLGAAGAAAVVVVAAVLAPSMPALLGGASDSASTLEGAPDVAPASGGDDGMTDTDPGGNTFSGQTTAEENAPEGNAAEGTKTADREIIATASATVRVEDVDAAATRVEELATAAGGYVEAMSVGGGQAVPYDMPYDTGGAEDLGVGVDASSTSSSAWVTIRVPAAELAETTTALADLGEVTSSQIDRRDVTGEAIDLRARVAAFEASVARLTELVAQAESTADLIAAEDALATRQSDLESYQQQLKYLDEQVGMSTLTVSLSEPAPVVKADPAGFGDGITAGWNGLLATLNGFVLALGFLLPWLLVIAIAGLIVWAVRRALIRRRVIRADRDEDAGTTLDANARHD